MGHDARIILLLFWWGTRDISGSLDALGKIRHDKKKKKNVAKT